MCCFPRRLLSCMIPLFSISCSNVECFFFRGLWLRVWNWSCPPSLSQSGQFFYGSRFLFWSCCDATKGNKDMSHWQLPLHISSTYRASLSQVMTFATKEPVKAWLMLSPKQRSRDQRFAISTWRSPIGCNPFPLKSPHPNNTSFEPIWYNLFIFIHSCLIKVCIYNI